MSTTAARSTSKSRQSLFFNDLATPVSSRRGKFSTSGHTTSASAAPWRENFASSDLPPPPIFTLDDRSDFSPESGAIDYPVSPDAKSDPRTPIHSSGKKFSTLLKNKSEASTSNGLTASQQHQRGSPTSSWWSPGKSAGDQEDKGKGSPVNGVVEPGALITLPPPREIASPDMHRSSIPFGSLNEDEWVTVYGFSAGDTNLVLREFEKCGVVLKHIPGPRNANWMHIMYQNRTDANKALSKNGMKINGALMVGVKTVDPMQRQALNERANKPGFMTLPGTSQRATASRPYYLQNGSNAVAKPSCAIASPSKSVVSKIVDLMFGV